MLSTGQSDQTTPILARRSSVQRPPADPSVYAIARTVRLIVEDWSQNIESRKLVSETHVLYPKVMEHHAVQLLDTLISGDRHGATMKELVGLILEYPNVLMPYLCDRLPYTRHENVIFAEDVSYLLEHASVALCTNEKARVIFDLLSCELKARDRAFKKITQLLGKSNNDLVVYGLQNPYAMFLAIQQFTEELFAKTLFPESDQQRSKHESVTNHMINFLETFSRDCRQQYNIELPPASGYNDCKRWFTEAVKKDVKYAKCPTERIRDYVKTLYA